MKKYIIPTTDVITIATAQLIAASGGPGPNAQQNPGKKAPRFHQPYDEEDEEEEEW